MALEVTDEMRKAVYEADCAAQGHIPNYNNIFLNGSPAPGTPEDVLPHIFCIRCRKVWLVIDEPADDYESAEDAILNRMKTTDPGRQRLKTLKQQRIQHKAEREAAEKEAQERYKALLERQRKQLEEEAARAQEASGSV